MLKLDKFILLYIILILGCNTDTNITLSNLKGKWINESNGFLEIGDTTSNNNYIGENVGMISKYLQIEGDTLSFQNRYSSSEDNYSINRIDRFDFKIIQLSEKHLSIRPLTKLAYKLFQADTISLIKQQFAIDNNIEFDNIIFHTTQCYGHCPVYHLEVKKDGSTKLHRERVYRKIDKNYEIDTTKVGFYAGKLSMSLLRDLEHHIKTCNLENLKFNGHLCCDGSITTIILDYNGKSKYLKDMFPPRITSNLINHLYYICQESDLEKTNLEFELQK